MSDEAERQAAEKPARRGEAAWKDHKDEVARRNEEVSKLGRARRESFERARYAQRMADRN